MTNIDGLKRSAKRMTRTIHSPKAKNKRGRCNDIIHAKRRCLLKIKQLKSNRSNEKRKFRSTKRSMLKRKHRKWLK